MSERANRRTSGPVLQSVYLVFLAHSAVLKSGGSNLEDGLAIGVKVHEPLGPRQEMIAARNANSFVLQPTDAEIMGILTTT